MNSVRSEQTPAPTATEHAASMAAYQADGVARARLLGNRGPVRLGADGKLHPSILDAYWEHGFYIFEGVIGDQELAELQTDVNFLLEHAPTGKEAALDAKGRPAYGGEFARNPYSFIKPLSDPWGGTDRTQLG